MKRTRNRFDWIARGWIAIGFFDLLFVFMYYVMFLFVDGSESTIVVHFCGLAGLLMCLGMIVSAFFIIDRKWRRLSIPGSFAIVWGLVHCAAAIAWLVYLKLTNAGPVPPLVSFTLFGCPVIGLFLILSGLYFILSPGIYLQDRARRLASRASHGTGEAQPAP